MNELLLPLISAMIKGSYVFSIGKGTSLLKEGIVLLLWLMFFEELAADRLWFALLLCGTLIPAGPMLAEQ